MRKWKIEVSRRLLESIRFELAKNGNEDATMLVDRIDNILGSSKKKRKDISRPQIRKLTDECEDTGTPEVTGIKLSEKGVEDIKLGRPFEPAGKYPVMEADKLVEDRDKSFPIAHVRNERIENIGQGTLAYLPGNDKDGKIILESIKFTNGPGQDAPVLGRCLKDGQIIPGYKGDDAKVGVMGWVKPDGRYKLTAIRGVGFQDTIFVSYDYEFKLPV